MMTLLQYDLENDLKFFGSIKYKLNNYNLQISACTLAGRKEFNSNQKPNEDAFSINIIDNTLTVCVFDGASSQKPIHSLKNQTGARFASHFLKNAFEGKVKEKTPKDILRELNKLILKRNLQFAGATFSDIHSLPASTATIAQVDPIRKTISISHVGDSFCILYYEDGRSESVTIDKNKNYDDKILNLMKQIAKEKNITPREARKDERVKKALIDMFQGSHNKPDGTGQGIINGDPKAEQYMQDISFPLNAVSAVFLGSDGIIPPGYDKQREADRKKLLKILKNGGFNKLIETKIKIEDNDIDRNFLRFKHSDDATGIFIRID